MLETDIIPLLVSQRTVQRGTSIFCFLAVYRNFAVGIGWLVVFGVVVMSFQRTAAYIHVGNDGFHASGVGKLMKIVLDGILREAVADSQDFDDFPFVASHGRDGTY